MQSRVSVPKIFLRGNRWYVRVQVPKEWQNEFRKKEYWISLKTSDRQEALGRATEVTEKKRWELITVHRKMNNLRQVLTELTDQQRSALAIQAYEMLRADPFDYIAAFKKSNFKTMAKYAANQEKILSDMIDVLRSKRGHHANVKVLALKVMERNTISLPEGSNAYQDILDVCTDAFIETQKMQIANLNGHEVPIGANPRIIDLSTGRAKPYTPVIEQLRMAAKPKPSLTALLDRFIDNPNKIRADKTKASIRGYMSVVIEILGDDTPVEEISEADCERVRDLIMKLPPNFSKLKALKNRPIEEMVRIANAQNMPTLSPTGVNNYIRWLITFLNWCQKKGMIDRVPIAFSEIKVADPVRKEDKRLPFANDQLQTIFHSKVFVEQERSRGLFWIFLIALWNGMRSNEICQLDAADVKQIDNIWGFDISHISSTGSDDKSIKTGSSIRMVPVHPKLIQFGFLDFHASRPHNAKLFGDIVRGADGYYSTNFSKHSNRYLKSIGTHGPKHKFHSFRHNFRDAIRNGRVDREIGKALGGWKRGNTDAFDIYGSGYPLDQLLGELKRVDYKGVDWSHLIRE